MLILGLSALTTLVMNPLSSIPLVFRKPHIELFWRILSLILTSAGLFIGSRLGFYQAIAGFVIAKSFTHVLFLGIVFRMIRLDYRNLMKNIALIVTMILALAAALTFSYFQKLWLGLAVATVAILLYFVLANFASRNKVFKEVGNLIRQNDKGV